MAKRKLTTSEAEQADAGWKPGAMFMSPPLIETGPTEVEAVCRFAEAILKTPHVFEQVCRELPERTKLDAVAIAAVGISDAIRRELKREGRHAT